MRARTFLHLTGFALIAVAVMLCQSEIPGCYMISPFLAVGAAVCFFAANRHRDD